MNQLVSLKLPMFLPKTNSYSNRFFFRKYRLDPFKTVESDSNKNRLEWELVLRRNRVRFKEKVVGSEETKVPLEHFTNLKK